MIKSFLKKVFSSSTEPSANSSSISEPSERDADENLQMVSTDEQEESSHIKRYEEVTLKKDWMEKHLIKEWNSLIRQCFEKALEDPHIEPIRIRLRLDEELLSNMDSITTKRIGKYIHRCEHEVMEFTFFLDKQDKETMDIYRMCVLPQRVNELNGFLQERCLMIYETSEALMKDYRPEIIDYFQSINIPMGESFFDEFEQWRREVFEKHEQEEVAVAIENEPGVKLGTVMIKISKEEVENENIHQLDHYMADALQSPETAKAHRGSLLFSFYGYARDGELLDLMNRKDVKDWASLLVEKHPYVFYFLNNGEYPMTRFLTSLVVTTEVEEDAVYYNEEELEAFRTYIEDALAKLAAWLDEDVQSVRQDFDRHFQ